MKANFCSRLGSTGTHGVIGVPGLGIFGTKQRCGGLHIGTYDARAFKKKKPDGALIITRRFRFYHICSPRPWSECFEHLNYVNLAYLKKIDTES